MLLKIKQFYSFFYSIESIVRKELKALKAPAKIPGMYQLSNTCVNIVPFPGTNLF